MFRLHDGCWNGEQLLDPAYLHEAEKNQYTVNAPKHGILDIQFRVTGFETVFFDNMGNAVPMASNGAHFSDRQRDTFRKLSRNKRFYILHFQPLQFPLSR